MSRGAHNLFGLVLRGVPGDFFLVRPFLLGSPFGGGGGGVQFMITE